MEGLRSSVENFGSVTGAVDMFVELSERGREQSPHNHATADWDKLPEASYKFAYSDLKQRKSPHKFRFTVYARGHQNLGHYPQPSTTPLQVGLQAEQVEPWQRFPHIETGYRKDGTHWQCALSMFNLSSNNESANAWTMVVSVAAGAWLFAHYYSKAQPHGWDAIPFWAMLAAQMLHCPASVGYHAFMPISAATANRWRQADLSLVLLLNTACTYALAYFTLTWQATLMLTAWALSCAMSGIRNIMLLKPGQPLDRNLVLLRVAGTALPYYCVVIYRGIAAAAALARSQGAACSPAWAGWAACPPAFLVCTELLTAVGLLACHGFGGACYATHWPQKQYPRIFDMVGHSHNLMHVFCFAIYVYGYPYLALLHSKRDDWAALH